MREDAYEGLISSLDEQIKELKEFRELVYFIAYDYVDNLSAERAYLQRDDWRRRCQELIEKLK